MTNCWQASCYSSSSTWYLFESQLHYQLFWQNVFITVCSPSKFYSQDNLKQTMIIQQYNPIITVPAYATPHLECCNTLWCQSILYC